MLHQKCIADLFENGTAAGVGAAFLGELASAQPPLVLKLARRPGERESRWAHLLCGEVAFAPAAGVGAAEPVAPSEFEALKAEQARLAAEVAALRAELQSLKSALGVDGA